MGPQGLGDFFGYRPLSTIGWRIVQILRQRQRKTTNIVQCQPLLMQYKHQANPLLSVNSFTPLVISRNDKNKHLTLLNQRKMALTFLS